MNATLHQNTFEPPANISLAELPSEQLIWLYEKGVYFTVKVQHILYCESQIQPKEHTKIFFINESSGLVQHIDSAYGIGKWMQRLLHFGFLRIHRAYLVNAQSIQIYSRKESWIRIRNIEQILPVSKEGKKLMSYIINKEYLQ
jgi:DNA-binding LytR/AlgR family response regulator